MSCFHPITLRRDKSDAQTVPCGKCDDCLLKRSREWSLRCSHELLYHSSSSFLTLTYRDDALVYGGNVRATLVKSHLQLFWKSLRKKTNAKFRYFACGEYGSLRHRPHYHALLFGYDFPDKKPSSVTPSGLTYYTSDLLDSTWGHGSCIIGTVTPESCAYVARYTLKKVYGSGNKRTWLRENMIEPEFLVMSLKPGIGSLFYDQFKSDMFPHDIMVMSNGGVVKPPRYYLKLLRRSNPSQYDSIMAERLIFQAQNARENKRVRLRAKEIVQKAKAKMLPRNYEG